MMVEIKRKFGELRKLYEFIPMLSRHFMFVNPVLTGTQFNIFNYAKHNFTIVSQMFFLGCDGTGVYF